MKTISEMQDMIEHQQGKITVLENHRIEDRASLLRLQGRVLALEELLRKKGGFGVEATTV